MNNAPTKASGTATSDRASGVGFDVLSERVGAAFADRFDGGYGLEYAGRWNERGRPVTYCATGPALCLLEKLVHVEDAGLLPDDTMLIRYHAPDDLRVEELNREIHVRPPTAERRPWRKP